MFKDDSILFGFRADKGLNLMTCTKENAAEALFLWATERGKVHELLECLVAVTNEMKSAG